MAQPLPDGYSLRLTYKIPHPELYAASDQLDEGMPWQAIVQRAVVECMQWRLGQPNVVPSRTDVDLLNAAQEKLNRLEARFRPRLPQRDGKLTLPWGYTAYSRYGT